MINLVYLTPGTSPGSLQLEGHEPEELPKITLTVYDQKSSVFSPCVNASDAIGRIDPSRLNWIDVQGRADVETVKTLAAHFDLGMLIIEDILTTQRPKMTHLGEGIFIITTMAYSPKGEEGVVEVEQLSIYFSHNCVVTFQPGQNRDSYHEVRRRLDMDGSMIRRNGTDYLVYTLLDTAVDHFFPVLEIIGDETEVIEEALVERPSRDILRDLFYFKRILLEMRRGAWPQREVFSHLMHEDKGLVQETTKAYLRDCYEHITQIIDIIENYRDLTAGLMDVYHSSLSIRTNEIMRVLTLVSTFFIPLTFLAGVYGMNFCTESPYNMPELHWRFGYLGFWGFSLLLAGGMFLFFRKRNWL